MSSMATLRLFLNRLPMEFLMAALSGKYLKNLSANHFQYNNYT
jgi:hypothetical protein